MTIRRPGRVLKTYTALVTWSVRHYFITVLIGFGIFAASIWSITLLPQGFLPAQDTARSLLAMELPPGSQLAYHREGHRGNRRAAAQAAGGRRASSSTAAGCRRERIEVRRAALIINYTPKAERKITQRQLELEIGQRTRKRPRHPLLVPRRKRPARDLAGRHRQSTATSSTTSPASWPRR